MSNNFILVKQARNGGNESTEEMDNLMPSNDSGKNKGSGQSFTKVNISYTVSYGNIFETLM